MRRVVLFLFSLVIIQLSVSGCSWVMYAALQCKGGCTTTEENLTPLHEAAQTGDSVLVAKLISEGANVWARTSYGREPILLAAEKGHKEVVEIFLNKGMDVKRTRDHGYGYSERSYVPGHAWTLLHSLSTKEYKHKEIVELLVDRGADVNARSMFGGDTPLHIAANLGHKEVVGILIAKGADINAQNSAGKTPLHKGLMCQTYNDDCKENVKLLIAKGADVSIRNKEGVTPLSYAIKYWPEMVELLKKNGAK